MTVKELIAQLQKCPPDYRVEVGGSIEGYEVRGVVIIHPDRVVEL